jgi:RHS repeat-associated protein
MKKVVIVLAFLLVISLVSAKDIGIKELFDVEDEAPFVENFVGGITTYFYAGSNLLASMHDSEINYYYQDRLGSDVGSKQLPFGQEIYSNNMFSFTGKELDSDLYYFGARYYDPNLGIFTSVDPVKNNAAYSYVNNNPMNFVDPYGLSPVLWTWTAPTAGSDPVEYNVRVKMRDPQSGAWSGAIEFPLLDTSGEIVFSGGHPVVPDVDTLNGQFSIDIPDEFDYMVSVTACDSQERCGIDSIWSKALYEQAGSNVPGPSGDYDFDVDAEQDLITLSGEPLPEEPLSEGFFLNTQPNRPNPFGESTKIKYNVPEDGQIFRMGIYDLRGRLVSDLSFNNEPGEHEVVWNSRDSSGQRVSSGTYSVRIQGVANGVSSFAYRNIKHVH